MIKITSMSVIRLFIRPLFCVGLIVLAITQTVHAAETLIKAGMLSAEARVWENRNGVEGSGYENYSGSSAAFVDNGWYSQNEDGSWQLFHEGPVLNLAEADTSITETLQYELVSGTAFFGNGPPGMYGMSLDGTSGQLITESGTSFNPHEFDLLRAGSGELYYYSPGSRVWWSIAPDQFGNKLDYIPPGPYKPLAIHSGSIPAPGVFGGNTESSLTFDIETSRYFNNSGGAVAGFHHSIVNGYRRWNNRSGEADSGYSEMSGPDIAYLKGSWYQIEDETHYYPFFEGRYLDFEVADNSVTEALQYEVTTGTALENEGLPSDLGLKLDGETGQLVDQSDQPVSTTADTFLPVMIELGETLALQGLVNSPSVGNRRGFRPVSTKVTLLRVVPLRLLENDPFNDRTLPLAIRKARLQTPTVPTGNNGGTGPAPPPPPPPPPSGVCALNSPLMLVTALPSSAPLGQSINILAGTQLQTGMGPAAGSDALNIGVVNPGDANNGIVSMGNAYSYVSGSSLGNHTENSNLLFRVRRNSDSAEFEISLRFMVDIVFDDMGIIIESLSGRQCTNGGPA